MNQIHRFGLSIVYALVILIMIRKSRLFVYTFLAVFLSIALVGAIVVPVLLNTLPKELFFIAS